MLPEKVEAVRWYVKTRGQMAELRETIRLLDQSLDTLREYLDAGEQAIVEAVPAGYYSVDGRLVKVSAEGVFLPRMEVVA